jgi:hypothetical protein
MNSKHQEFFKVLLTSTDVPMSRLFIVSRDRIASAPWNCDKWHTICQRINKSSLEVNLKSKKDS